MTRFHIVGIGGMGMSAIAQLLRADGHQVSGSDQGEWPLAAALARAGATIATAFAAENVSGAEVVVHSSAYGAANPELAEAQRRAIPLWRRQDAWRFLALRRRVVAIAGTHGKSTTTALVWTTLRAGGLDPSLLCGAVLRDLGSNAHAGGGDILVVEADEYDRAFLALRPEVAVVTNVEHDHVDVFPTFAEVAAAFREFASGIVQGGTLVASADDAGARTLAADVRRSLAGRAVRTYGAAADADYRVSDLSLDRGRVSYDLRHGGAGLAVVLRLPGQHNAHNSAAALATADTLGVPAMAALPALAAFSGTERRLEVLGTAAGVTVVDDYAHHPTEIAASLAAMRPYTRGRLVVLFQPHTPSRLAAFFEDFVRALAAADVRIVAETFASARERSDEGAGARALATRSGATYVTGPEEAATALAEGVRAGDLVLVLGAGDIRPAGERLLVLLRERVA